LRSAWQKEGFDWIWCEHALTIGYRSSLTEIVQIIGRATRDAKGKTSARFTNLIAEPDATEEVVAGAVNDTLKAIAASLLMEQVLAPRFNFTPKTANSEPEAGFDYGPDGYGPNKTNVGVNQETGEVHIEIKGLIQPESHEAQRICKEDLKPGRSKTEEKCQCRFKSPQMCRLPVILTYSSWSYWVFRGKVRADVGYE
jgi:superfamily II DNA or RNA helicase